MPLKFVLRNGFLFYPSSNNYSIVRETLSGRTRCEKHWGSNGEPAAWEQSPSPFLSLCFPGYNSFLPPRKYINFVGKLSGHLQWLPVGRWSFETDVSGMILLSPFGLFSKYQLMIRRLIKEFSVSNVDFAIYKSFYFQKYLHKK